MNQLHYDFAIKMLKDFEPKDGYYLCFSGGKDSIALYRMAQLAEVKFDAHYNYTTVDPPDVVKFIKENYPEVEFTKPTTTMWKLIVTRKMLPTIHARFCCRALKEIHGKHRIKLTGVRAQESVKRSKFKPVEIKHDCFGHSGFVKPLFYWKTKDIWEFINEQKLKTPDLYNVGGFKRVGCIGCPMASKRHREEQFERYPKIKLAYLHAIERMLEVRDKKTWETAEECFDWWMNSKEPIKHRSIYVGEGIE